MTDELLADFYFRLHFTQSSNDDRDVEVAAVVLDELLDMLIARHTRKLSRSQYSLRDAFVFPTLPADERLVSSDGVVKHANLVEPSKTCRTLDHRLLLLGHELVKNEIGFLDLNAVNEENIYFGWL